MCQPVTGPARSSRRCACNLDRTTEPNPSRCCLLVFTLSHPDTSNLLNVMSAKRHRTPHIEHCPDRMTLGSKRVVNPLHSRSNLNQLFDTVVGILHGRSS